jgi:hypothetical protein
VAVKDVELELLLAGGILLVVLLLVNKGVPAAQQAYDTVDGQLTSDALQIPGLSILQDQAGDFDPVQAGYEAADAMINWLSGMGTSIVGAMSDAGAVGMVSGAQTGSNYTTLGSPFSDGAATGLM